MKRKWPRILIVDDHPVTRVMFRRVLAPYFERGDGESHDATGLHGEIVCAPDAEMALRLLSEEGPFDVVVTDLLMEPTSGFELLNRIRAGETENESRGTPRDVPVGVCSYIATIASSQFDFVISKDHAYDLFIPTVNKVLGLQ